MGGHVNLSNTPASPSRYAWGHPVTVSHTPIIYYIDYMSRGSLMFFCFFFIVVSRYYQRTYGSRGGAAPPDFVNPHTERKQNCRCTPQILNTANPKYQKELAQRFRFY